MADEHAHVRFLRGAGHEEAADVLAALTENAKPENSPAGSPGDKEREMAAEMLGEINRLGSRNKRSVGDVF